MRKIYLLAAVALVALASCTCDEFVGDNSSPNTGANGEKAISFGMSTPTVTRASGADAAQALDYKFKVYATKTSSSGDISNVFATGAYSSEDSYNADPDAYWVWYLASTAGTTTSDTKDWDYVGVAGSYGTVDHKATIESGKDQTIKYWDYSAKQYDFVAYSATVKDAETAYSISKYNTNGFTITATAAELAGFYVADKVTLKTTGDNPDVDNSPTKPASAYNKIGDIVQFTFRSSATKVRLGIYETIPGYVVQNIKFRANNTTTPEFTGATGSAKLSGSFNGESSSARGTYDVTYNSTTGVAEFDNKAVSPSNYYDFGSFVTTAIGETSITPTWATGSATYQSALPNTDNVNNMILYVDYDLYNDVSKETIHVKGAKAVVPSIYMKWNPNFAYTYLFKISDNTNGTTGTEGQSPEGIYPITFDALTIAATGEEVGTITTVSTPAITTYQNGSVSPAGITYANANGSIYITVNTAGTLAELTEDNMRLYTVATGTTEADLILTTKTKTAVTGDDALSILISDDTKQDIKFTTGKAAEFTPAASTTYAVEYLAITEETGLTPETSSVTGLYLREGTQAPYTYTKVTDANAKAESGKTYCTVVPQYKIIVVGANPVNSGS